LRPGRIDKSVFCGFPGEEDRKEILKIFLKKYNFEGEPNEKFLNEIASKTLNFTNADIKGLCQNAQLAKL
jgi:peroxin-1